MPVLLVKTSRDFLATRSKIPSHFPAAHKRISTEFIYTFSRQSDGRHNTLDFAKAKSCAKEGCGPLWKPPEKLPGAHLATPRKPPALVCWPFAPSNAKRAVALFENPCVWDS